MITPPGPIAPTKLSRPKNDKKGGHYGAFTWPERFFLRDVIPPAWENTPSIKEPLQLQDVTEAENKDLLHPLKTQENWAPETYRIECFLDIFHDATLRKLEIGEETVPSDAVALLIDGNNKKGRPQFRSFLKGLSAKDLLRELTKKRYLEGSDSTDGNFIEAERRLIYIDTLDPWSILALLGTAPSSLHRPLTEFILDYIRSKCSVGVSFATEGPSTFSLQFSFPYKAYRSTKTPKSDPRIKESDQEPLRLSTDITFLKDLAGAKFDTSKRDMIYSSHVSLVVTGYDQFRWTGVGVAEAWFEDKRDEDPSPDTVARYEYDYQDAGCLYILDPLCRGKGDTLSPIWSPRSYFIHALEVRLEQIYREWEGVLSHFHKSIKAASKRHKQLLLQLQELCCNQGLGARDIIQQRIQQFEQNVWEAKDLLRDYVQELEEIIRSGERFMNTDVNYFLHEDGQPGDASECIPYLSHVRQTFHNIAQQLKGFSDLREECEQMLKLGSVAQQSFLLQIQINRICCSSEPSVSPIQNVTPHETLDIKILSCMAIVSQPLLNTAAIFSCDGIIPFPRTWYYFFCSWVAMVVLLSLSVAIRIYAFPRVVSLIRRKHRKAEEANITLREFRNAALANSDTRLTPRRYTFR
ncbi:hypothetical protein LZ30DRAFT_70477 [Colletotrichum cereale]|nr:hypothetical protein LZ30DRAFT_70477 [Colletotrichum cereale]